MPLTEEQVRLLRTLSESPGGERVDALAARLGIDQARIAAAAVQLRDQGLLRIDEEPFRELAIRPDGRRVAREGFPERRVLRALIEAGERSRWPTRLPAAASRPGRSAAVSSG